MRETFRSGIIGLVGLIGLIVLSGCAAPKSVSFKTSIALPKPLQTSARVYVEVPGDGVYQLHRYEWSGMTTAYALSSAAAKRFSGSDMGAKEETDSEARKSAEKLGDQYVLAPVILHWEDRATE